MKKIRRHGKKRSVAGRAAYRERCTADNIVFDSVLEKDHYLKLKTLANRGIIRQLKTHPKFTFEIEGETYGTYEADFSFVDADGDLHVQDVKAWEMGPDGQQRPLVSREFVFQAALVRLQFGIKIEVV